MNNEISNKSLSLSSVDASLAAIIPDTPIVSIAGSTLSEITTTTTSTTTTPIPTATSYESNKVDISLVKGPLIKSMSGVSPKFTGAATHCATASSTSTKTTTDEATTTSEDVATVVNVNVTSNLDTIISIEDNDINIDTDTNSNASNLNLIPSYNTNSNTAGDDVAAAVTTTAPSLPLSPTTSTIKKQDIPLTTAIAASSTGNTKADESTGTDRKSKDSELQEEKKVTDLDDQKLKLLLEEAFSYRRPTDKENKSELFLSLLKKAENEKEDTTLYHMPTSSRLIRSSYTSHSNHPPHHHHRHKHGGSLQDLDEAVRIESILDPDYFFGGARGQRNRRHNHNSRQKKYSISVSSRQREGGSLPNNVNFTNCARLFGVSGGGGTVGGDVAGVSPQLEQQFPFMHEMNTTSSGGNSVCGVSVTGNTSGISYNIFTNSNSSTKQQQQQARSSTGARSNAMSTSSVTTTSPSAAGVTKTENEPLVGQPIKVVIGGQVTVSQVSSAPSIGTNINNSIDAVNACYNILNATSSANDNNTYDKDTLLPVTSKIIDVRQKQKIMLSKSPEAISQGFPYYDRLENVEIIPHSNILSAVPSRTNFGPTTANAYIDDKIHFAALRNYNASGATTASAGAKTNQMGGIDTKYLPLGDNYKSYKSVLAISDKDDGRGGEVDENGNAVSETFPVNSTHASVATATLSNPLSASSTSLTGSSSTTTGTGLPQAATTKSKSKKQPKQERNVTTVDLKSVAGYRGTEPVEKLLEYIESTTYAGEDNKNTKQKRERKKQEKQDKHSKIKKSNSLEELRSCSKMEVDELKRTAATTESNVMMRNKSKGGKNNSSSVADINKNFESNNGTNSGAIAKEKTCNVTGTNASVGTAAATNRKGERRSWGTEELQYLGDANSATEEKFKEKEKKNKNRDSQKDRAADEKDKSKGEKCEKVSTEATALVSTSSFDKTEKQQVEKLDASNVNIRQEKLEKRKKGEQQQTVLQHPAKSSTSSSGTSPAESTTVVDILAMDSLLPETAEFHVVTKKKKTKKQRMPLEEPNCNNGNMGSNKAHNFISSTLTLKSVTGGQQSRFNAKFNSNDHSNNNNNNNNCYQQHHNNHYHNQNQYQHQQNSDKSRRKSTSSVPPSEKSDSSDLDSVHSLPIERAAKSTGSNSNVKITTKQARQNKNTAVSTMNFQPKPQQQQQQLPTPFSYAEIAKEAKSFPATISLPTVCATPNNNTNDNNVPPTSTTVSDATQVCIDETKFTPSRGQHQVSISATTNVTYSPPSTSSSSASSNTSTATPVLVASVSNSSSLPSNNNSTASGNKSNKTKKSTPKPDFPALSSASDVAVAASVARADIFAKAVLNSSQNTTASTNQQQHLQQYYSPDNDSNESIPIATTSATKSSITSNIETQKDFTTLQQSLQHYHHQQQPMVQPLPHTATQQQQTLHKSKSVEHDNSTSSSSNITYSHPMDHQQYPALKTVKRHSASNFAPLSAVVSTSSTVVQTAPPLPPPQQQNMQQFNFAAAARQMVTGTLSTEVTPTSLNIVNAASSSNVSKPVVTDLNINVTKKNKKEKQQIMEIGGTTGAGSGIKSTSTTTRKSTTSTQTNTAGLLNNNEGGKQQNNSNNPNGGAAAKQNHARNNAIVTSNQIPGTSNSLGAINRPAVIILNDDSAGVSSDFTFGDFNEDELHFFDDDNEEYACAAGTAADDETFTEHLTQPKLTSSPRSDSTSATLLNDSGTCSDLVIVNNCNSKNNISSIQQNAISQLTSTDDPILMGNADTTLSSNNSTLTENQHNSNSSGCGHSNHSADSGIYTITSTKVQGTEGAAIEEATGVNAFLLQHTSSATNDTDAAADKSESSSHQPRQLETCNEIESAIIAAARRAANQQQLDQQYPYTQQKSNPNQQPPSTTARYQHSNSSSFSSSSSTDGGVNRFYSTAQSPPPPPVANSQQQQPQHYYNNRQGYQSYQQQPPRALQQYYHMLPNHGQQQQQLQQHTTAVSVSTNPMNTNIYSRSNSECDDYVSPSPDRLTVKLQNKEYDLRYLPPPNMTTTNGSQNEVIVDYVASVWDEVVSSKYTKYYEGQ